MKTKHKFFLIAVLLLVLVNGYYFIIPLLASSENTIQNKVAELRLTANDLVENYASDETKSNNLFSGKIIEVTGTIKEITFLNDRITIILNSTSKTFGIICDINPNEKNKINKLKKHQKIKVKGICKGFLKDVILLNCSIDLQTHE